MSAVLLNAMTIAFGACVGVLLRRFLSSELMLRVEVALGYCVIVLGIKMALAYENYFIILAAMVIGILIGHFGRVSDRIDRVSELVQNRFMKKSEDSRFALGFSTASILFCTGAMAIVGAINAGASNDLEVLHAKAVIDGILSIAFGALYGVGVAFSAIPVFIYEGALTLCASKLAYLAEPSVMAEIKGIGGILLLMIGFSLARVKEVKVADFLPAIPVVMILMYYWR